MKKIISCIICGKHRRDGNTYKAQVEVVSKSPLTGEKKTERVIGKICADCANNAGYKVRKELLNEN